MVTPILQKSHTKLRKTLHISIIFGKIHADVDYYDIIRLR